MNNQDLAFKIEELELRVSVLEDRFAQMEPAPVEEKPVEEKPVEEKPVEEKPVEEKPVEEKPVEEKPVEEKPVEGPAPTDEDLKKAIELLIRAGLIKAGLVFTPKS
jgi:cell division septation protein DedD